MIKEKSKQILFNRIENLIQNNNFNTAKKLILFIYDSEKDTEFISTKLLELTNQLLEKERLLMNKERIKQALILRAESLLRKGRITEVKDIILKVYDLEKESGFISTELVDLADRVLSLSA